MPRKKTLKDKKLQVQKQKIAARLLEISFKADDYIYKKKSISVEHAQKYLEEVEKLEPKCQGDVRSMQVVEKLTQLMKSIIEQGRTSQGSASQSTYNPLNITSTNASTLDSSLKSTRSVQVQTNKSFEIQNIIDHLENKDTFDKTNAPELALARKQAIDTVVELNLEKTLSNLSLSIIDPVNNEIFVNNQIGEDLTCIDTRVENSTITNDKATKLCDIGIPVQASKDQEQIRQCTVSDQIKNDTIVKSQPDIITIDLDDDNESRTFVLNKPNNFITLVPHDEIIVESIIDKKKADIAMNKNDLEKSKVNKQRKTVNKVKKNTNNTKPKRSRRNTVNSNTILTEDTIENKNRRRKKNTKGMICDLSWVENIKYVRIIETSEHDTSFDLQESFWDNCYLPYDFSKYF